MRLFNPFLPLSLVALFGCIPSRAGDADGSSPEFPDAGSGGSEDAGLDGGSDGGVGEGDGGWDGGADGGARDGGTEPGLFWGGPGWDEAVSVARAPNGWLFVAGSFQQTARLGAVAATSAGQSDVFLAALYPDGGLAWLRTLGGALADYPARAAVSPSGDAVAVAGFFGSPTIDLGGQPAAGGGGWDGFVAVYDAQTGAYRWSRTVTGAGDDRSHSVAFDRFGNVLLTGQAEGPVDFGSGPVDAGGLQMFLASFEPDGSARWIKLIATSGGAGRDVAADSQGNVYVTGDFGGPVDFGAGVIQGSTGSAFFASYSPDGGLRWVNHCSAGFYAGGTALAADGPDEVFATGIFQVSATCGSTTLMAGSAAQADAGFTHFTQSFLASLGPSGAFQWVKKLGSGGAFESQLRTSDLELDGAGNPLVAGYFDSQASSGVDLGGGVKLMPGYGIETPFVASWSPAGTVRWAKALPCLGPAHGLCAAGPGAYVAGRSGALENEWCAVPGYGGFDAYLREVTP